MEVVTTTRRQLDGVAATIAREVGVAAGSVFVEGSTSGYFIYARGGSKELLFGETKGELFERAHALLLGIRIARGEEKL